MKQRIVFFESESGSDKQENGLRADTMPMVNALISKNWEAEIVIYSDENNEQLFEYVTDVADAYVSRINPGNLPNGEKQYHHFLRRLSDAGVIAFDHPDLMVNYGAKSALVRLADTALVPNDTFSYHSTEELRTKFPKTLAESTRILKQNRGAMGVGVWRVELLNIERYKGCKNIPLNAEICCTEAVDNHVEMMSLDNFLNTFSGYFFDEKNLLIDMPYLPRIKEGEMRVLMIGNEPVHIVHKKPVDEQAAFSATLYSGAEYRYDQPSEWPMLTTFVRDNMTLLFDRLGNYGVPLLWSMDFILSWDELGNDNYVLSEVNSSCVGFASQLELGIQDKVADEIIDRVTTKMLYNLMQQEVVAA